MKTNKVEQACETYNLDFIHALFDSLFLSVLGDT